MLAVIQPREWLAVPSTILSQDPGEVIERVSAALAPHHMRMLGPSRLAADLRRLDLGPVSIVYIEYGAAVEIEVAPHPTSYLVHAAIEGESRILDRDGEHRITVGNLVVTAPATAPLIRMSPDSRHLCVRIDAAALRARAATIGGGWAAGTLLAAETEPGSPLPTMWRDLVMHLYRQASAIERLRDADGTRAIYAAMLMDLLLRDQVRAGEHGDASVCGIAPWHVRRACRIIDAHLEEPLLIADLAAQVGVSVRSLQNGFRQFKGVTPAEHIRQRRLSHLHEALQRDQGQRSVTDLMLDAGIANFGRFAKYYRQRYGRLPSETLRERRVHDIA